MIQRASKFKIFFSRHQQWWFLLIHVDRISSKIYLHCTEGLRIRFPVILYPELELDNFFHPFNESWCFRLSYTSNFQHQKRAFLAKREESERVFPVGANQGCASSLITIYILYLLCLLVILPFAICHFYALKNCKCYPSNSFKIPGK